MICIIQFTVVDKALAAKHVQKKFLFSICAIKRIYKNHIILNNLPLIFQDTHYKHNIAYKHKHTTLSKYIWYLKNNNIQFNLEWSILDKAKSFNPVTGVVDSAY